MTASWKRSEKIAQFRPDASSFGIDDGRVLVRAVAVTVDIADNFERVLQRVYSRVLLVEECRAHNLIESKQRAQSL